MERLLVGETVVVHNDFLGIVHGFQTHAGKLTGVWVRPIVRNRNDSVENHHACYDPANVRRRAE